MIENKNTKNKIVNDPVFGFISIPNEFVLHIIQHPFFQRLNRIRQLGLASFVYPGAQHTRLHHSIGAMFLMNEAIKNLQQKGHIITQEESDGALASILLHDIGHGPFSHVLEHTLTSNIHHEDFSLTLMEELNREMGRKLDLCLRIFKDEYPKHFLHQLVSGQLDVDRLDYLRRDSFFTGVTEGNIGSARIIKMLNVKNDKLVVEEKGIYSIENFLMARRLMYWQVYLHKTCVAAEKMLIKTLKRAKELSQTTNLFASPSLLYFLNNNINKEYFEGHKAEVINHFVNLDDNDIWCALKVWTQHDDIVLSKLSQGLVDRVLFKIKILEKPVDRSVIEEYQHRYMTEFGISQHEASFFCSSDIITTNMYSEDNDSIDILYKDNTTKDIADASDMLNIQLLAKKVDKHYFSYFRL